ncbi:inositol polyphosphate 5-phosphatase 11 [Striga asiatica]|uniref:Inositol polyphosphate 5-phosphatase 11 n=1 Tax=Striga asiatica TaxID=4170 RepID=A0A5A7PD71_STRAF|nr:inositol polyphosphate 5-phosphatase 11 [Striga asiatica]
MEILGCGAPHPPLVFFKCPSESSSGSDPLWFVCLSQLRHHYQYLIDQNPGAIETNAAEDFEHGFHEADVEHGLRELEVAKVAGAVGHAGHARLAPHPPVDGPQPRVAQARGLRLTSFDGVAVLYTHHRHTPLQEKNDGKKFGSYHKCTRKNSPNINSNIMRRRVTISSGLRIPNWTARILATSAVECGKRKSMAVFWLESRRMRTGIFIPSVVLSSYGCMSYRRSAAMASKRDEFFPDTGNYDEKLGRGLALSRRGPLLPYGSRSRSRLLLTGPSKTRYAIANLNVGRCREVAERRQMEKHKEL